MKEKTYKVTIFYIPNLASETQPRDEIEITTDSIVRKIIEIAEDGYFTEPVDGRILYHLPHTISEILYEEKK